MGAASRGGTSSARYNNCYTLGVKTAISIPDPLFEAAERLARRLGVSRSKLYSTAVAEMVAAYRESGVTEALDSVYSDEGSRLDDVWLEAQSEAVIGEDDW